MAPSTKLRKPPTSRSQPSSRPATSPLSTSRPPVHPLIHSLHTSINRNVDSALTWEQLHTPEVNYSIVRPLVDRYSGVAGGSDWARRGERSKRRDGNSSGGEREEGKQSCVIYALMVNRIHYLQLSESDLAFRSLNESRAALCELLAVKLLRKFADDELELVSVLTTGVCPFDGASEEVWKSLSDDRADVERDLSSALEMAILSQSKHFLATPLAQKVINLIHSGRIVYTSRSSRSFIVDDYQSKGRLERVEASGIARAAGVTGAQVQGQSGSKGNAGLEAGSARDKEERSLGVHVYDPTSAGWLDHARLRIPVYRTLIDFSSFLILTVLFIWNLSHKTIDKIDLSEALFMIFAAGFSLDEFASSNEHGWTIYLANAWNAFDVSFLVLFWAYVGMRFVGLMTGRQEVSQWAFDLMSNGAIVLLPRLVFFVIKDNVLIVSLKAMIREFVQFMCLATVCFSGIGFTLWTLGRATWTARQIGWLMLQIWFGSSYLGFSASASFHPVFGPIILVLYAALSNTLLVTILISILSNRFAAINSNAKEEHLFQKAINTIEGVKADAIFSYAPPLNILALIILGPLSLILSPHNLHRVNVFAIRLANFPVLFGISCYERWRYQRVGRRVRLERGGNGPGSRPKMSGSFMGSGSEAVISAVFENSPSDSSVLLREASYDADGTEGEIDGDDRFELDADASDDPKTTPVLGATPTKATDGKQSKIKRVAAASPHSPLSKVFNRTRGGGGGLRVGASDTEAAGVETEQLRREIHELKASQARMEEMVRCLTKGLLKPSE